ncbi:MAG TPA: inositol 2-dehydrogenase [Gammaproteobacteria bacterium]
MIGMCVFGAGRIGSVHAANVARRNDVKLHYVVDINRKAAQALADKCGAKVSTVEEALADKNVQAVIIGTATDTHADLIVASAKAGKAIFCEKPVDLDIAKVNSCLEVVKKTGTRLALGFNRRFDHNFEALHAGVQAGKIGKLELVCITSRDPSPPPVEYIKVSGGLFRDMMIHDLDMARWLMGEDPAEVFAYGSCLVDPAIGKAGDIDTAVVSMKSKSGVLCQISNSRRAVYGYDQRIEVFGSKGMLRAENETPTRVEFSGADGVSRDKPLHFFMERYALAYQRELDDFVDTIKEGRQPRAGGEDGRWALLIADAAMESFKTHKPVSL